MSSGFCLVGSDPLRNCGGAIIPGVGLSLGRTCSPAHCLSVAPHTIWRSSNDTMTSQPSAGRLLAHQAARPDACRANIAAALPIRVARRAWSSYKVGRRGHNAEFGMAGPQAGRARDQWRGISARPRAVSNSADTARTRDGRADLQQRIGPIGAKIGRFPFPGAVQRGLWPERNGARDPGNKAAKHHMSSSQEAPLRGRVLALGPGQPFAPLTRRFRLPGKGGSYLSANGAGARPKRIWGR
jgi:hypothetical protein